MNLKQLILYAKRDILRYAFICLESACRSFPERILELRTVEVPAGNVYMSEVVNHLEKHVCILVYSLEAARVVGKLVVVGGAGVPQQYALHLARIVIDQHREDFHDVSVGGIANKDELSLGEGLEDLVEHELAYLQGSADFAKVEGPSIEGTARIRLVDEVHV